MNDDVSGVDGDDTERPESLFTGRSNPRSSLDYIVVLAGVLDSAHLAIRLRYIPDKLLVDGASFSAYLAFLDSADPASPELVAFALLDEMNNEIVPRWLQIAVSSGGSEGETVIIEDRQPNWENPGILDRLPPL